MKRTVELGFLLAVALILSYVESLIPFTFGIPGIKLGLPNLIVLLLLYSARIPAKGASFVGERLADCFVRVSVRESVFDSLCVCWSAVQFYGYGDCAEVQVFFHGRGECTWRCVS